MSITIGMGYCNEDNDNLPHRIRTLADKFGYGVLIGIDYAEADVRGGLEVAKKNSGWDHILFLQSPIRDEVSLAFGIDEELTALETESQRPKFFDFLIELSKLLSGKCRKVDIFFAGEWYKDDRARYSYGTVDDLISLLTMPGHWGIRYMVPQTGHLQDSDETPLLFSVRFR